MTPRDDNDENKHSGEPDPNTGGADLGADWLLSQLNDTGAQSTIGDDDSEIAPSEQTGEESGGRWLRRRRSRRRAEQPSSGNPDAVDPDAPATTTPVSRQSDDGAPTQAFDVVADRADEKPVPPTQPEGGVFAWGLTPNADADPWVAGESAADTTSTPDEADIETGIVDATEPDGGEPTQAFDPFADHEPEPVSPEQAAVDGAFASPDAYDRLYDEATLSSLDADDDDDMDAVDEPTAAGLPVPKSAVAPEPVVPEPV